MNNYFINITESLDLKTLDKSEVDIDKFQNQIHKKFPEIIPGSSDFDQVSNDNTRKEI